MRRSLAFSVGVVFSAAILVAAERGPATQTSVLNDLHHANQMEIDMGKMAQSRGSSDGVKKFGDTLVKDHTDADKKVADLASSQNVTLEDPMMMTDKERKIQRKLESLNGSDFDRAFAKDMVDDHEKDIAMLKAAQPKIQGTPTGELVAQLLPVLESHRDSAKGLVSTLKS